MVKNGTIDERTVTILTYGLCGFTNLSAFSILLGGMNEMAPNQKPVVAKMAFKALLGGTCACLMTGCIAGMLL